MLISPKRIQFKTKEDVIDYVSKSIFPPSKKNFETLKEAARDVYPSGAEYEYHFEVLKRIHLNRIKNRDKCLIAGLLGLVAIGAGVYFYNKKVKDQYFDLLDYDFIEMPDGTLHGYPYGTLDEISCEIKSELENK